MADERGGGALEAEEEPQEHEQTEKFKVESRVE